MKLRRNRKKIPVEDIIGVSDDIGKPSKRSAAGKKAKTKGGVFERKIGKKFEPWWGSQFFRTPMSGGSKLKHDYNLAGDICTPAEDFPFHVECKNQEALGKFHNFMVSEKSAVWKWWKQCTDECPGNQIPLLVFTKNHIPVFVMMEWGYWFMLSGALAEVESEFEHSSNIFVSGKVVVTLDTFMAVDKQGHLDASTQYWKAKAAA